MYRRACALIVVAVLGVLGGAGFTATAVASPPSISIVAPEPGAQTVTSTVTSAPTEDESHSGTGDTQVPKEPVAEQPSAKETPVILVTGLAVLLAAILMVVRSGSTRRVEED